MRWLALFLTFFTFFSFRPQNASASPNGENIFKKQCASCHTIGGGRLIGPDLRGVMAKRGQAWLVEYIKSPSTMRMKGDPEVLRMEAEYGIRMPDFDLSENEIEAILQYIVSVELEKRRPPKVHDPYRQPIDFSHKLHAGDYKISCLYCHSGAEKSRHAGHPPANVCLNCHSQIRTDSPEIQKIHQAVRDNKPLVWFKRHDLQDYAYFNHSRHVNAGVACQTCHGEVEAEIRPEPIKITMGWCLKCHRQEDQKQNRKLFGAKHVPTTKMDCARCHH